MKTIHKIGEYIPEQERGSNLPYKTKCGLIQEATKDNIDTATDLDKCVTCNDCKNITDTATACR